jgi:hypothetical protein
MHITDCRAILKSARAWKQFIKSEVLTRNDTVESDQ